MTFIKKVGSTWMQRHDVVSTLRRRCIKVMCLLGVLAQKTRTPNSLPCALKNKHESMLLPVNVSKIAGRAKNSVDSDHTP